MTKDKNLRPQKHADSFDVIRTLLQGASSTSTGVSDFEVLIFFGHNVGKQCYRAPALVTDSLNISRRSWYS